MESATTNTASSSSFLGAFFTAYYNLVNNPLATFIYVLSLLSLVALANNQSGPIEVLITVLKNFSEDSSNPALLISLAKLILTGLGYISANERVAMTLAQLLVIYIIYPDKPNITLVLLIMTCFILLTKHPIVQTIILLQLTLVYYSLNKFFDRLLLIFIFLYFTFGSDNLSRYFTNNSK